MAPKVTHIIKVAPKSKKEEVNTYLENLQNLPQHKWIPIEGIQADAQAFCTPRQALWMTDQVDKQVEGATMELVAIAAPAEAVAE